MEWSSEAEIPGESDRNGPDPGMPGGPPVHLPSRSEGPLTRPGGPITVIGV